jgi:hypothetical protein
MKRLFLALAGIVSTIPGITVWQSGLGTPPDKSLLFGGVVEAFGALSLMLLWVNRTKIRSLTKSRVTKLSACLILLCFVLLSVYVWLFGLTVVKHDFRGTAYYPLWTSGDLVTMVKSADNSRYTAIEKYGIDEVNEAIHKMPNSSLAITTIILLLVYQAVFSTLIVAFGILGIHEESEL